MEIDYIYPLLYEEILDAIIKTIWTEQCGTL